MRFVCLQAMTHNTLKSCVKAVRNLQLMQCTLQMLPPVGGIYGDINSILDNMIIKTTLDTFKKSEQLKKNL